MDDEPQAWEVMRPLVAIAGRGIWTEVLARLVHRSGGATLRIESAAEAADGNAVARASVVVAGPPYAPAELVSLCAALRDRGGPPVIVAMDDTLPAGLARDLAVVGAAAAVSLDDDLRELTTSIANAAGFPLRRSHRGVLLSPVLLRSGHVLHTALAADISEGGLGIEDADATLVRDVAEAQFHLPGDSDPITVGAEAAWVEEGKTARVRAGIRFRDLDPLQRAAIRRYRGSMLQEDSASG